MNLRIMEYVCQDILQDLVHLINITVWIFPQCTLINSTLVLVKNLLSHQIKIIIKCITYTVDITCLYNNVHFNLFTY